MKRLTIAMSDGLYGRLLGYAADQSKSQRKRISLGETMRTLVSARLDELRYDMPLEACHESLPSAASSQSKRAA
jgi:hypothetical protein